MELRALDTTKFKASGNRTTKKLTKQIRNKQKAPFVWVIKEAHKPFVQDPVLDLEIASTRNSEMKQGKGINKWY